VTYNPNYHEIQDVLLHSPSVQVKVEDDERDAAQMFIYVVEFQKRDLLRAHLSSTTFEQLS
jgi:hypothetical protein